MTDKLEHAREMYLSKRCWRAVFQKRIIVGTIVELRYSSSWLEAKISWDCESNSSWERVSNLGFEELPQLFKGD